LAAAHGVDVDAPVAVEVGQSRIGYPILIRQSDAVGNIGKRGSIDAKFA
jgi:hypothetical protein